MVYEARRAQGFIILECQSYLNYYLILRFIFTHFFPSLKEISWGFFCLFFPNLILFFITSRKLELSVNWHCHSLFPMHNHTTILQSDVPTSPKDTAVNSTLLSMDLLLGSHSLIGGSKSTILCLLWWLLLSLFFQEVIKCG